MPFPLAPLPPHPNSSPTVSLLTMPCTTPPSTLTQVALLSIRNSARVATATYGKLPTPIKVVACSKDLDPSPTCPPAPTRCSSSIKRTFLKKKKPTYVRVVCVDGPEKTNPKQVRWTAGGGKVEYTGNVTTQTANIQTAKYLFNSVVSTPNGHFITLDLKDFYLCSDLPDYEYVRIPTHR
jgi:hypothetical protein